MYIYIYGSKLEKEEEEEQQQQYVMGWHFIPSG